MMMIMMMKLNPTNMTGTGIVRNHNREQKCGNTFTDVVKFKHCEQQLFQQSLTCNQEV